MNSTELAFEFLMQDDHEVIIYGVLKRLNITKSHKDYDDLLQEGRLAFIKAYQRAPKDDGQVCLPYIYQGVYWDLLDYLKRQTRINQHQETDDDNEILELPQANLPDCEIDLVYQQILKNCDNYQRKYLIGKYQLGLNPTEMARYFGVSRKTIYQWKQGILEIGQTVFED